MKTPEILVIGAGPGGCVAAIEHARRGHRVWLCEQSPKAAARRLAGEWLHNTGRALLEELQIDLHGSYKGGGFVVHAGDGGAPITLPYVQHEEPSGLSRLWKSGAALAAAADGLSWEHADLVDRLRARAIAEPQVRYMPGARVRLTEVGGDDVTCTVDYEGKTHSPCPDRIVDATGRAGVGRRVLSSLSGNKAAHVSRMCGLELRKVEVPVVDYGHVVLGGPGPMLMYRIGEDSVRVVVDVPRWHHQGKRASEEELCAGWGARLPGDLPAAFRRALQETKPKWVNIDVRVRRDYGAGRVALIGDAVGHYHPLTASGMTNAVLDASSLARHERLEDYARERTRTSKSAGLLGVALYDMFAGPGPEVAHMRAALFERWRTDSYERRRTMGYLGMGDQRVTAFMSSYLKVVSGGIRRMPRGERMSAIRQSAAFLQARAPWLLRSFGAKAAAGPQMVAEASAAALPGA